VNSGGIINRGTVSSRWRLQKLAYQDDALAVFLPLEAITWGSSTRQT
jgi:hypothetical protein